MTGDAKKVRTPYFPLYVEVQKLLGILNGIPKAIVRNMLSSANSQAGASQAPVDWSKPDEWIARRLSGKEAELAARIWKQSGRTINPRHIYGTYTFINTYGLLTADTAGIYHIAELGKFFNTNDTRLLQKIDDDEGLLHILALMMGKGEVKSNDVLPEWGEFLHAFSNISSPSMTKESLRRRLLNLADRKLVTRTGNTYTISTKGMQYAEQVDYATTYLTKRELDARRNVLGTINEFNAKSREALRKQLSTMHPYRFEHLIRDLLEAMGYEDVIVTKESGDKGVDVIATVQFGITTLKEVVQVKRYKDSVGRPMLDQFRGALHHHNAIRGTIITLGRFSKDCIEAALIPNAAPIGLIDGEKLLDMLLEYGIGVKKQNVTLNAVDEGYFAEASEAEEVVKTLQAEVKGMK